MKNREVSYTVQWDRRNGEFQFQSPALPSRAAVLRWWRGDGDSFNFEDARIVKTTITREVVWKSKTLKKKRKAA